MLLIKGNFPASLILFVGFSCMCKKWCFTYKNFNGMLLLRALKFRIPVEISSQPSL